MLRTGRNVEYLALRRRLHFVPERCVFIVGLGAEGLKRYTPAMPRALKARAWRRKVLLIC